MYAEERQQAIATQVKTRGRIVVSEAAEIYDVTTETVRRDLAVLERLGLLHRVHGGAVSTTALTVIEPGLADRHLVAGEQKDRIAHAAMDLIPRHGGSVLLDAGTTTARLAAQLPELPSLTVVTNSVPIAAQLVTAANIDVHVLPGRVRHSTHAAVGPQTVNALRETRVDVAFIGTNALTAEYGLSTPDPDEAAVKSAMIAAGRRVVVLADSTKLGQEQLSRFGTVDQMDVLITDDAADPSLIRRLESLDLEVVIA